MPNQWKYFNKIGCLVLIFLTSCRASTEESAPPEISTEPVSQIAKYCYASFANKDSIVLNSRINGDSLIGTLAYNGSKKENNNGPYLASIHGDTIIGIFNTRPKGTLRQVVFLLKDNHLIEGIGETIKSNGQTVFKDISSLKFSGTALKPTNCN
ncbi:hypothetical protein CLV98_104217 [Dyadobacter jejuensis]|uniref:Uncharacterized protein n=1 Tax=Dyadobacter jejuensis TaxID=1082580 RepID=A0A316ALR7_9BACT|nr:hypothetical protein [Dyadobacter jejuensis]PWJ58358.1 hypothetical protein CLV98_104217 [Dyadobacter jejuensis]